MKTYRVFAGLAVSLTVCGSAYAGSATTVVQLDNLSQHNANYYYYITQTKQKSNNVAPNTQLADPLTITTSSSDGCKHSSYNITVTESTAQTTPQSPALALCGFVADIKTCYNDDDGGGPMLATPHPEDASKGSSSSDTTVSGSVESGSLINNKPVFPGSSTTDICSVTFQKNSSNKQTLLIKVTTAS